MKSLLWAGLGALLALHLAPHAEATITAYCGTTPQTLPATCAFTTDSYISNGVVQANFNKYNGLMVKSATPPSPAAGLRSGATEWLLSGTGTKEGMALTWVTFEDLQITNSYVPPVLTGNGQAAYLYTAGNRRLTPSPRTASVYDTFTQQMYTRSLNYGGGCGLPWTLSGFWNRFCWSYTDALQVAIVHEMGDNQNFMKTSVTIRNVDYRDQDDVYFMRALNPAPDGATSSKTWVRYQSQTYDGNDTVVHPDFPNVGAVVTLAGGQRLSFVSASRLGRVNHASSELNPVQAWGTGNEGSTDWVTTAGDGSAAPASNLFQFITFNKPQLTPGETFTFEYGVAFSESTMENELIPSLVGLTLLYPTSHISPAATRLVAKVNATTLGQPLTAVNFHLFRQSSGNWVDLGTADGPDSRMLYTLNYDFTGFAASTAQLQVEVILQDGTKHFTSRMLEILTGGTQFSFPSDDGGEYLFVSSSNHVLDLTQVGPSGTDPTQMFFFLEAYENGGMQSITLPVDPSAPWQVTVTPEDMAPLTDGAIIFVKAVSSSSSSTQAPAPVFVTMFQGIYRPNSPPTDIKLDRTSIDENRPAGTAVAALTTVDPDVGQGHTYVLIFNPDNAFYIQGSTLFANQPFDYEVKSSYEIQIRSYDPYDYVDKTFFITINNVNDLPTKPNIDSLEVPEDYPLNTPIVTLVSTDEDGDAIYYYISSPQAFFTLGLTTGVLQLAARLDFETGPHYLLGILIQDSQGGAVTTQLSVNVTDVNEAPTQIILKCATDACVILEESPIGMWVGNLSAVDQDVGDVHTFEVVDNAYFEVQNVNQLVVKSRIKYEVTGISISVEIKTTDRGGLSFTQTLPVVIQDVNDPADALVTFCNVDEDREKGDTVAAPQNGYTDICQVQVENSQSYDLTYVIPGEPPENGNLNWTFTVQDCSGIFFVNNSDINYESNITSYNVTVDVYGPGDAVARTNVIIKVYDVNEPPVLHVTDIIKVDENSPSGTVVVPSLLPYTTDPDKDESFQYIFWLPPADNPFDIDLATGRITVAPGANLNYEARSVYNLQVRVDDRGDLFSISDLTIMVRDVNEPPELVGGVGVQGSIAENSPDGTALTSLIFAIDQDVGQTLTFEIVGGNELGVFGIRSMDGMLSPTAQLFIVDNTALDFETHPQFNLTIQVTDNGDPQLSAKNWFIIALIDVNEPPFFPAQDFSVFENIVRQTPVGIPLLNVTVDPDAGDVMTFVIQNYNDDSVGKTFSLDPSTGQLELSALALSFERKQLYTYEIRVSDQGGLSYSNDVRIHVLNVEEAPVYVGGTYAYILENEPIGTFVQIKTNDETPFLLVAQDDDGDAVTFTIVSVNGAAGSQLEIVPIPSTSANLRSKMKFDYEELNLYQLNISFTDGVFTLYQAVTVQVVDVNDNPVFPSNVVCYTQITAVAGDLVCTVLVTDEDTETSGFRSLEFELLSASSSADPDLTSLFSVNKSASLAFDLNLADSISDTDIAPGTKISVSVRVTDGAGASDEGTVTVIVNDVNAPPKCPPNGITFTVLENKPANTEVGDLATSGISDPQGVIANYTLASGTADFWLNGTMLDTQHSFDFETQASYAIQIKVTDPEGLATTCVALIVIGDMNEPTVLLDQARFVDETAVSGTLRANGVLIAPLSFTDPDAADQNPSWSLTLEVAKSGSDYDPIDVDAGGNLLLKPGMQLDYETQKQFFYTIRWESRNVVMTAELTLNVLNVEEPPSIVPGQTFTIAEDQTTTFGYVQATDPDFADRVNFTHGEFCKDNCELRYAIVSGNTGNAFTIDARSGALTPVVGVLDFENRAQYTLSIRVTDNSGSGMSVTGTVTIYLTDVNDCTLTQAFLEDNSPLVISTAGGTTMYFRGTNLGPTLNRETTGGMSPTDTTITLTYQDTPTAPSLEFEATGCQLNRTKGDNTVVSCTSVAGVGSNLGLKMTISVNYPEGNRVCVASVFGNPSAKVSYEAPEITGMINHIGMPTNGTTTVTITGANFGPFAAYNVLSARYGKTASEYQTDCVLTESNTEMECQVVPGIGKNLQWSVIVGGASSAPFGPSSYAVPHVQQLSGTLVMNTRGGETVTLTGRDFGPLGTPVAATYGQGTCTEYTATACTVLEAHTKASCQTVPGVGVNLQWCITIGEQTSDPSEPTTRYSTPVLAKVLGAGTSRARTEGGDYILLQGDFFGPLDTDDFSYIVVEYGPTAQEYVAVDCVLRTAHTQIECLTAPGTGKDHSWRLWIAGQWSAVNPAMTSYAAPVVGFYEGPGENDADTRGFQAVTLLGENFGTAASGKLQKVVYSRLNGTVFDTTDTCSIIVDHRAILCLTLPGAGESLQWTVTVDGQLSEVSSTDYAPPVITALSGLGAVNASVYGNQQVVITGNYFGPKIDVYGVKFLQSVTYGPTGVEYAAKDCLVQDDSTILCQTTQGVGQNLHWLVTVEGQMSELSEATTSYALPELLSADPLVGYTSGGGLITLKGRNLATFDNPKTYFDGQEMVTSYTIGQDTIFATVPEGWGRHKEIYIAVGGARTTSVFFDYFDPHIDTVNAKPVQGNNGTYLVVVEGTSFSANPKLYLTTEDGERVLLTNCPEKDHRTVVCETTAVSGEVQIVLSDEIYSNVAFYDSSEPTVVQVRLVTGEARTVGGAVLEIVAQGLGTDITDVSATVGGRTCALGPDMETLAVGSLEYNTMAADLQAAGVFYLDTDFQRIQCTVPEGQGTQQSVVVNRGGLDSLGCGCSQCTPVPCFDYLPPVIATVTPLESPTTGGGLITLTGDNFGLTPQLFVGGREWPPLNNTDGNSTTSHTKLIVEIAAFEGAGLEILVDVANQTAVAEQKFSYLPPTVDLDDGKPFMMTDIPTTGTDHSIILTGSNFGVLGPVLTIGGVQVPVLAFGQTFVAFRVPEGQGAHLPIVLNVSGQLSPTDSAFLSYAPPRVTSYWPLQLSGDTRGGEPITLIGENFGLVTGKWKIAFTRKTETGSSGVTLNEVLVTPDLIVEWNHTYVEFITPPGQGQNRTLNFTVGGQLAEFPSTTLSFSYNRPSISGYLPTSGLVTEGGLVLTILGTSFGVSDAVVTIMDPLANSTNDRMTPQLCAVLTQDHELITCTLPAGLGGDLELILNVDDSSDVFAFAYDPPSIDFFWSSSGGSAAGGEELRVYGQNFGSYRTPAEIYIDDTPCENSLWLADDRTYDLQPYLRCPSTPAETVGVKNVTIRVAYQWSEPNDKYSVRCKAGYYGGDGEMCANCGEPSRTGCLCPRDDMYMPIAAEGWWRTLERTPFSRCDKEMQDRTFCPALWPCVPSDACLGNNTCAKGYDASSERCAQCEIGYYRLNGRCAVCPTAPWLIFLVVILAGMAMLYVGYLLAKKQVNVGILSIGVDYFQVLAIFSNSNVSWPSTLVYLWNVMSVFNLNIDIFAPECWQEVKISYKLKWTLIQLAPLAMFAIAFAAFLGRLLYKVIVQKRRNKLAAHGYKLLGAVIIIFYYLYLYIANTTLAVFNCQAPEPPDGHYYMQDVGTDEGMCYKKGTMQQQLEPWAILCIIVYVVGFPLAVGLIIFFNANSIFKDQLLRATRADKSQIRAAGTWNFRKRYQRLYYQFKPQWYFWILVILARKFCLSVVAVLFRNNTIFMLAVTMLVLFIAYVLQVRHGPYMSMSEYDDVAKALKPMVDELYATLPKRAVHHNTSSRRKQIKFGEKMSSVEAQNLRMLGHHAFFNDYNTVESVLLCSAVVVALSGIMFDSGQLSHGLKEFVTFVVIFIVVLTIAYFLWVLTTEVWIAFLPGTPILWCYDPWSKEEPAVEDMELQDAFEVSAGGKHATTGGDDIGAAQKQFQLENAVLAETVAMQQNEIAQLKKANKALELAKMNAPKKQVKQKREFKTSQNDLSLEADDSTTPL